jgi:hypothetical protein
VTSSIAGKAKERGDMKFRLWLSLSLILYVVMPVFAQSDAKYEVSAGYSFLRDDFSTNRHGAVLSFTEKVGNRFGIEAEVGGNYRKSPLLGNQNDFVHSILAGPQFKLRNDAKFVPWAHVLVGITLNNQARLLFLGNPSGGTTAVAMPTTNVRLGFQPGGGIDYWLTSKFGVRFGADYRRAIGNFEDRDFFRLQSGVVVRF